MRRSPVARLCRPAALTVVACLTLLGCSPSGSSPAGTGNDALEATELTIGVLPIVDVAPVFIAIEEGLFAAEGLTVTTETMEGGAAAIPALVGGDLDIAFGAWPSFLLANEQGIELRAIADGDAARAGFTELLALPESGLEGDPAGLAGRRVAVNTLGSLGEMAVRSVLRAAGADPSDVDLVQIPFPDMPATLERGDVDAIWASEPIASVAKSDLDAVIVADSFTGELDGFPVAGYQATADFAADHPNTIAAFRRALTEASDLAAEDRELVTRLAPDFTSLTPDLAAEIALPAYSSELEVASLERVYDYLVDFGLAEGGLDVGSLVLAPD
jgi:NitT/TauT family transport system substrate-binding protein